MLQVENLTKRYGDVLAVDDLSFTVEPGRVTGFLGPNGAGKSTTLRAALGLLRPDAGRVLVQGRAYADLDRPLRQVGAVLDARAVNGGRRVLDHLRALARSNGIPRSRAEEVLDVVGLGTVGRRRAKGLSLGMSQRLGLAAALLGDPPVLLLDEPVNGLDPDGVLWLRRTLRELAAQGRAVLVSSHLMAEMALAADHVVVIGKGRLLADCPVADFVSRHTESSTYVRAADPQRLAELLRAAGCQVDQADGGLEVRGATPDTVGETAARNGVTVFEISHRTASLEQAFLTLTADEVVHRATEVGRR